MSKRSKKSEAQEERITEETAYAEETTEEIEVTSETPAEEAAENEYAAEETSYEEEIQADEVNGAEISAEDAVSESDGKIGTVNKSVNFRTGPTFKNSVIAELKAGSKVILSETVEGDKGAWYKCEFDGRIGYVKSSGISVS